MMQPPKKWMQTEILEIYLHFISLVPKYDPKDKSNDGCHKESDGIILRISPVRQVLFPEASSALSKERLRIFCWEM